MSQPPQPFPELLHEPEPRRDVLENQILSAFEESTGERIDRRNLDRETRYIVAVWLSEHFESLSPHYQRLGWTLTSIFHPTLSNKINRLSQQPCAFCRFPETDSTIATLSVRIPPQSRQAINPEDYAAFKRAIASRFKGREPILEADKSVCILITFVVRKGRGHKDLDNMAKLILDATKGVLFGDDRRIDHLNIVRVVSPDEEFVKLHIRETRLNEHVDVFYPHMHHSWAGAPELNLDDFRDPPFAP